MPLEEAEALRASITADWARSHAVRDRNCSTGPATPRRGSHMSGLRFFLLSIKPRLPSELWVFVLVAFVGVLFSDVSD